MQSFSWRQACSSPNLFFFLQDLRSHRWGWIRPGLLIKKHNKETQCHTIGCSKFYFCNLKQAARFWDGILPVVLREERQSASIITETSNPEMSRSVIQGRVGSTLGFTLCTGTMHPTIAIEQAPVWKYWWENMIRKRWSPTLTHLRSLACHKAYWTGIICHKHIQWYDLSLPLAAVWTILHNDLLSAQKQGSQKT